MCGICMTAFSATAEEQEFDVLGPIMAEPATEVREDGDESAEAAPETEFALGSPDAADASGASSGAPAPDAAQGPETAQAAPRPVVELAPQPAEPGTPVAALHLGYTAPSTIRVYLPEIAHSVTDDVIGSFGTAALTSHERAQILSMIAEFERVIDVDFEIVSDIADADFGFFAAADAFGDEAPPQITAGYWKVGGGQFGIDGEEVALDGWGVINPGVAYYSEETFQKGGIHYAVMLHEMAHGMGMDHPHDGRAGGEVMSGVDDPYDLGDFGLNQNVWTVMSYNFGWEEHPDFENVAPTHGGVGGLMALDIAYLQAVYGANEATGLGDDVYVLDAANGPGTWYQSIWDTGGIDTIAVEANSGPAYIDLRAATLDYSQTGGGVVSFVSGVQGGVTIAAGVVIENAEGGVSDDFIRGNEHDNELLGRAGHDEIHGGDGKDRIEGGDGQDALFGDDGKDRIFGKSGADEIHGGRGDDLLRGNDAKDVIHGDGGDDEIEGGAGADTLFGGAGADLILGGGGNDVIDGGAEDDRIEGGTGRDTLTGSNGADLFVMGESWGKDTITDFEQGIDLLVFDAQSGIASLDDIKIKETEEGHAVILSRADDSDKVVIEGAAGLIDAADILFEIA